MDIKSILEIVAFLSVLAVCSPFLGRYIACVLENELTWARPLEKTFYKLSGIDEKKNMDWKQYLSHLLIFNGVGFIVLFLMLFFQNLLPLNPQNFSGLTWHLAFNTAVSFMTNTNWQSYSGEVSLSHFSQMFGLTVQNFVSAATGIAVIAAFIRGLRNKETKSLGNFWQDLVRITFYILLPISIILTILLLTQGVIQNFGAYQEITTLEGLKQLIPTGPAASQIAIKQLGTNGGGFFGVNSAHPFENPTPFSNFLQVVCILLIPISLLFTFGKMLGDKKQGMSILWAMNIIFIGLLAIALFGEYTTNINSMEGIETRFGHGASVLWAVATTAASNGSVNSMHSSLSPLVGFSTLFNMMTGEVIFGGVGAGLYGMMMYVILTVFIAGLMVGRSPEYLGKKIEAKEVKLALIALITPSALILIGAGLGICMVWGLKSLSASGPHGLTELLYGFTSTAGNNGSAFGGLSVNNPIFNTLFGFAMLIGRFVVIIPVLMIAGSLSVKKYTPVSSGTFPTDGKLFTVLLISVVLILGALTFFPALCLGPVAEHFLQIKGITF